MRPRRTSTHAERVAGLLRLIRWPNLVLLVLTQYLARMSLISPEQVWYESLLDADLFWISLATVCIAASGYIINDYYDIKIDLVNRPQSVVIGRYIKRRWALGIHNGLNLIGLAIGFFVDKKVFLVNALAILALWVYSNRLKRLPFWGNLMVSFLTGLSLVVLAVHYQRHEEEVYIYALFAFSISLIREIIKDMEDVRGDANFGCRTLPIVWGIAGTKAFLYVLIACFLTLLLTMLRPLNNPALAYVFLGLLLPVGYLTYRLVRADTRQDFAYLSRLCKGIMLVGVLSMVLV
jgi:4-hydroxybenzoate polyprenyltransferase